MSDAGHSRPIEEDFNKLMDFWFKELFSDQSFQAELVFGGLERAKYLKSVLSSFNVDKNYLESLKTDTLKFFEKNLIDNQKAALTEMQQFIGSLDNRINSLKKQIEYFQEKNDIPNQDYPVTPYHFARMLCVGFALFPKGKSDKGYLELFKNYLEDPSKLEAMLLNTRVGVNEGGEGGSSVHWIGFLTNYRNYASVKNQSTTDWRKRTKEKYERVLLSSRVGKDVKSKSRYLNEWKIIESELNDIKNRIREKMSRGVL